MIPLSNINYLAVIAASAVNMILGMLWYSPVLFGKMWMNSMKLKKDHKKSLGKIMTINTVMTVILAYILSHFIKYLNANTAMEGAIAGFWIFTGFVLTTNIVTYLYEGRELKPYFIYMGYQLVALILMGALLAIWP